MLAYVLLHKLASHITNFSTCVYVVSSELRISYEEMVLCLLITAVVIWLILNVVVSSNINMEGCRAEGQSRNTKVQILEVCYKDYM